jgi:hypothetical protein
MKKIITVLLVLIIAFHDLFSSGSLSAPPLTSSPPTTGQINRILTGVLALVEAQHSYYAYVAKGKNFAPTVRELGWVFDKGGLVTWRESWDASDAVQNPKPVHGYLYKILPIGNGPDAKAGFVVASYPAENRVGTLPVYLSIIPNAQNGMLGMTTRNTWELADPELSKAARDFVTKNSSIPVAVLDKFDPKNAANVNLIVAFKKEER